MPVYNGVEFLEEAVRSVVAQTFGDWELLIGINGHGDAGGAIRSAVESAALLDVKRIHVYVLETVGKSASLNALVEKAAGTWICLLDCDDIWDAKKLEMQHTIRQTYFPGDADVVLGTVASYFGDMVGTPTLPIGRLPPGVTLECNPIVNSTCMLPRRWASWEVGNELEDYDLWLRLDLIEKIPFCNVADTLCGHRVHRGSAFNSRQLSPDALVTKYRALSLTM